MAKYRSKLPERKEIAEGTMEFHFSKLKDLIINQVNI
jgi:hypothetical protein